MATWTDDPRYYSSKAPQDEGFNAWLAMLPDDDFSEDFERASIVRVSNGVLEGYTGPLYPGFSEVWSLWEDARREIRDRGERSYQALLWGAFTRFRLRSTW